jgi:hypothetical protein
MNVSGPPVSEILNQQRIINHVTKFAVAGAAAETVVEDRR